MDIPGAVARYGYPRQPWEDQYWQATVTYLSGATWLLGVCADDEEAAIDAVFDAILSRPGPPPVDAVVVEPLQQPGRRPVRKPVGEQADLDGCSRGGPGFGRARWHVCWHISRVIIGLARGGCVAP